MIRYDVMFSEFHEVSQDRGSKPQRGANARGRVLTQQIWKISGRRPKTV